MATKKDEGARSGCPIERLLAELGKLPGVGEKTAERMAFHLLRRPPEEARALAYRLYSICEKKGWAQEALAYNTLAAAWGEVQSTAAGMEGRLEQGELFA